MEPIILELDKEQELIKIEEQPHPLEEVIQGALEDNDNQQIMNIFVDLYKEERHDEIKGILTRQLFTPGMISTALENIAAAAVLVPDQN